MPGRCCDRFEGVEIQDIPGAALGPVDDARTQTATGVDAYAERIAVGWIGRESYTADPGIEQGHDEHGHDGTAAAWSDLTVVALDVGREDGCPDLLDGMPHICLADAQAGAEKATVATPGAIFDGSGTAHRERHIGQAGERLEQFGMQFHEENGMAHLSAARFVAVYERGMSRLIKTVSHEMILKYFTRHDPAVGHGQIGLNQLDQIPGFAADFILVVDSVLF